MTVLWVALGAALGAPLRYLIDRRVQSMHSSAFPWGTLTVNVLATFVLGTVAAGPVSTVLAAALGVGFCGAASTWSTLGYETVMLMTGRRKLLAAINVVVSVLAGLGAAALGFAAGTSLWG